MNITSTLKLGSSGDQVRVWQRILMAAGYDLFPYNDDGEFGEGTQNATISWQKEHGVAGTGIVDNNTLSKIDTNPIILSNPLEEDDKPILFIQATNYQKANRPEVKWIIIHSAEAVEASTTAENVARWFGSGVNAPMASAHFCLDDDSIVQCVKEEDVAYHAKSANKYGIGLEHAGFAKQTRDQWLDSFSTRMLKRSAKLTASICKRWNIPAIYVDRNDLKLGHKGISTHNECTFAFENGSGHSDPGASFPMDLYIQWVQDAITNMK